MINSEGQVDNRKRWLDISRGMAVIFAIYCHYSYNSLFINLAGML